MGVGAAFRLRVLEFGISDSFPAQRASLESSVKGSRESLAPFCPFCFRVPSLKPSFRKKGTLTIEWLLRNLEVVQLVLVGVVDFSALYFGLGRVSWWFSLGG